MGLILDLYRSSYDSELNAFHGKREITLVNADGPFEPTDDRPAARLTTNAFGDPIIVADLIDETGLEPMVGPMFGGTYAATSDSRFGQAMSDVAGLRVYGALPVHDRYETREQYARMSS